MGVERSRRGLVSLGVVVISLMACALPFGATEPTATPTPPGPEARAGTWIGSTEFGTFTFDVAPDGQSVTGLSLTYNVGIVSGSIEPEGEFSIAIDQDGSFALIAAEWAFVGQISEDGQRATGTWEMGIFGVGEVADDWMVER